MNQTVPLIDTHQIIRKHIKYNRKKMLETFISSVVAFVVLRISTYFIYEYSIFISLCISMVSLVFFVGMFAVFHEHANNIFFKRNIINLILGHFIGTFFYTPFIMWRDRHNKYLIH
ncbi:hypothetical protein ZONE111905_08720 [Zobellia nedashkovskayae]